MRFFVRLMALLLIAALVGPFFLRGPDGRPLATWDGVQHWFAAAGRNISSSFDFVWTKATRLVDDDAGKTPVYRWRDASGTWHFSDQRPEGVASEQIWVDGGANVMDAPPIEKTPDPPKPPAQTEAPNVPDVPTPPVPLPLSVPPDEVRQLIEDAKDARQQIEERRLPE